MKLAGGTTRLAGEMDRDEFLRQVREYEEVDRSTLDKAYKVLLTLLRTHPFAMQRAKELDPTTFTKSGVMVGLGETKEEVMQVMDDMRSAGVDFITIGQYLQPTRKHAPIDRFVTPEEFKAYEAIARAKGFLMVSSSPLTRSSHHAGEDYARLRAARDAQMAKTGR